MTALGKIIAAEIGTSGPIPFSRFMELCLYHPAHGYYRGPSLPIGKEGDYYTSPCVHRLFGHLVARQILEIADALNAPEIQLVEAGAGRGHLARDICQHIRTRDSRKRKISLVIIEPHAPFRDIQHREINEFCDRIEFVGSPGELDRFSGVFYSNELFDAFPVEILEKRNGSLKQIYVRIENDRFVEQPQPLSADTTAYISQFEYQIPDDMRTEICPSMPLFYRTLLDKLEAGAVLTVDYGYTQKEYLDPSRNRGTLMAYREHLAMDDVYDAPGEQDLTSHINFTVLKKTGEQAGTSTIGYTEQQYFLMGCGFVEEVELLHKTLPAVEYQTEISKIKGLIMPGSMGTTFKVLCQAKGLSQQDLCGFSFRNQAKSL